MAIMVRTGIWTEKIGKCLQNVLWSVRLAQEARVFGKFFFGRGVEPRRNKKMNWGPSVPYGVGQPQSVQQSRHSDIGENRSNVVPALQYLNCTSASRASRTVYPASSSNAAVATRMIASSSTIAGLGRRRRPVARRCRGIGLALGRDPVIIAIQLRKERSPSRGKFIEINEASPFQSNSGLAAASASRKLVSLSRESSTDLSSLIEGKLDVFGRMHPIRVSPSPLKHATFISPICISTR
jgi:hypothetical protein